eukprot:3519467-Lingulodinium_polyedra.AAC.1
MPAKRQNALRRGGGRESAPGLQGAHDCAQQGVGACQGGPSSRGGGDAESIRSHGRATAERDHGGAGRGGLEAH